MEKIGKSKYDRQITHRSYPTPRKKNAFWAGYLPFEISEKPLDVRIKDVGKKKNFSISDDEFLVSQDPKIVIAIVGSVLGLLSLFLFYNFKFENLTQKIFTYVSIALVFLFTILYYFTVPQKELILNRLHSKLSFPNSLWGKPFTMPFTNLRLGWGGGAVGSPSPDRLIVRKPVKWNRGYMLALGGNYFEELSFLVWYMDKNRPLPPGDAFDGYRKKDYQRRKAEGFPPPIFRSFIQTPEYKGKWQKERDRHWRDIIETDAKGNQVHRIWQSAENVERHGEWEAVVPQ